ncbi:hypothetical protein FACS1894218_3110 [Bacilli bacterium]|nr:hypothetical protein FACS1894218_3110 [Bacilli bacterium]
MTQTMVVIMANKNESNIFCQIKPLTIAQLSATVAPLVGMNDLMIISNKGINTKTKVNNVNGNNKYRFFFVLEVE